MSIYDSRFRGADVRYIAQHHLDALRAIALLAGPIPRFKVQRSFQSSTLGQRAVSYEAAGTVTEINDEHASFFVSHVMLFVSLTPVVLYKLSSREDERIDQVKRC